jgi:hypothetical protein
MDSTLIAKIKNQLQRLWGAWSGLQDREDERFRIETGIGEASGAEQSLKDGAGCEVASTSKPKTPTGDGAPDLSDLINKRNAEFERGQTGIARDDERED